MIYLYIDGMYIDCTDAAKELAELYRDKKLVYTRYVMMSQFISYGLRKVVDADHKTIFQMSETEIRPKTRAKKHESEQSLS